MSFLDNYDTYLFDLDGLLIDSLDRLSSSLIGAVSKHSNASQLNEFKGYDVKNPGLSRFEKVEHFVENILKKPNYDSDLILEEFDRLSLIARTGAYISPFIFKLHELHKDKNWILLTNCDNNQLLEVSQVFKLNVIFGESLIGTPPSKAVRAREIRDKIPNKKVLSISDSKSDYLIARQNKFDFLFIEEFSRGNQDWNFNKYFSVSSIEDLVLGKPIKLN
jgi:phosphoglycolate phosphatase-like HAD superfamily hydrolase